MRKFRRTITHIDPVTVLKLSLFYYAIFFVVWLIFMAILYNLVAATGVFDAIQTITDVFGSDGSKVEITFGFVMRWTALLGIIAVVLGSIVNWALAVLYNVGSDVVGGVSVSVTEREE